MINARLRHLGIYTNDIEAMVGFYTEVLGMVVTDDGPLPLPGEPRIVFLSAHADEHHELALVDGGGESHGSLQQLSFEVDSISDLREIATSLEARGHDIFPVDHCMSYSVYTPDPDGHLVELYTKTPWFVPQPVVDPLDLGMDDATLTAHTVKTYEQQPGFMTREEWVEEFEAKLEARAQ